MSEGINILDSREKKVRIALIGVIVFALIFCWFAVRWQLGNMLAELTPSNEPNAREIAHIAVALAPRDPQPRWLAAVKEKENFTLENIDSSLKMLEDAVRLSPYDYRWWVELGRAYEQSEEPERAELAFKHAVDLAPSYTIPRWHIGNFYLRHDRVPEAFAELKKATEKSIFYRNQVFSLAWDFFGKDPARVEELAADTPATHATLALFYALRDSPKDSLRIWNQLDDAEKARYNSTARTISQALITRRFYRETLEFALASGFDPDSRFETITNGGFEKPIANYDETMFGWHVFRNQPRLEAATDLAVQHEGTRSLRVSFKNYSKPTVYNVLQLIAVEPLAKYRVSFWLRTDNMKSGGPPLLEVVNAKNDQIIAASAPFPLGSTDWQEISIDFTVPESADGIVLRTSRSYCGEECPITGTFWYDDFRLGKLTTDH